MQRIKTRSQFQKVLINGATSRTVHFALHRVELEMAFATPIPSEPKAVFSQMLFSVQDVWMGAMVPKRWAKRAVTRNTIKRMIYAVAADFSCALPVAAYVVRLRAGFDRALFHSATSDALKMAARTELHQLLTLALQHPAAVTAKGGLK